MADLILATAIKYLAMREHSALELQQKLHQKGFDDFEIKTLLFDLVNQDIQNDVRFAESFIRTRISQGKGEILIKQQLKQKGINDPDLSQVDFYGLAEQVKIKKFGKEPPTNAKNKAKQMRFLQSRGFNFDQINAIY